MIDAGMGNNTVARALDLSPMTVSRINADRVKAYAVLERWKWAADNLAFTMGYI